MTMDLQLDEALERDISKIFKEPNNAGKQKPKREKWQTPKENAIALAFSATAKETLQFFKNLTFNFGDGDTGSDDKSTAKDSRSGGDGACKGPGDFGVQYTLLHKDINYKLIVASV
jgi:hypothetical protein